MPQVNHEILSWARKTAGFTPAEAAKKLGIKSNQSKDAVAKLLTLESGQAKPSRSMLVQMSKQYQQPLLTFYLAKPPRRANRGADFRHLSSQQLSTRQSAITDLLLRDVRVRQSMIKSVLEDEDEDVILSFTGSITKSDGKDSLLKAMRELLEVDYKDYRAERHPEDAFKLLRSRAEEAGIFVLLQSNLGHHSTTIDIEHFRGFAIADNVAPFIVINEQDSKPACSFALLHEIAHLLLGETGISGSPNPRTKSHIEKLCNDVASEFLLPRDELSVLDLNRTDNTEEQKEQISEFAKKRHISHTMVAYVAWRENMISQDGYENLARGFRDEWVKNRKKTKKQTKYKKNQSGGPTFYIQRQYQNGTSLIKLVHRMTAAGALTTTKAAVILGVKPTYIHTLCSFAELH